MIEREDSTKDGQHGYQKNLVYIVNFKLSLIYNI